MANPVAIGPHVFTTQKAANEYAYAIRDKYAHQPGGVTDAAELAFLTELYTKYCEYTGWNTPGQTAAFFSRNIFGRSGYSGKPSLGFVVRFDDADQTEREFSAEKAIREIAKAQKIGTP